MKKRIKYLLKKIFRSKISQHKVITGFNNTIINHGIFKNVRYDINGDNNQIFISKNAKLTDILIFIRGHNHILEIKKNCEFKNGSVWFEDNGCTILIKENTTIESAHLAVTEPGKSIIIGKDCMLSTGIEFRTGDSHTIIDLTTNSRINYARDIEIKDHVWIGANSIILKGVTIESNSIIATNSVVTKDIPANSIAAGIPAKILRNNITWLRERIYQE